MVVQRRGDMHDRDHHERVEQRLVYFLHGLVEVVVFGRQEIKVNAELREVMVTGIVRPEDIDYTNTISHEKIAELRVAYGGRGTLSDIQQPRWGTQIIDVIFPF